MKHFGIATVCAVMLIGATSYGAGPGQKGDALQKGGGAYQKGGAIVQKGGVAQKDGVVQHG